MLTGMDALSELHEAKVVIFGVGGVGSWCADALIRSGIKNLTIVDSDLVCVTNINRQVQATTPNVGKVKVDALRDYLLTLNPRANIEAVQQLYNRETADQFDLSSYDYIIDAIDSLSAKVELIVNAVNSGKKFYSSFGASNKVDATRIEVTDIWKTKGCRLGKFVRKRLRKRLDECKNPVHFPCVYSEELLPVYDGTIKCGSGNCACPSIIKSPKKTSFIHEWCSKKQQINGSAVHITGTFGFILSGLIIQDIMKNTPELCA